VKEKKVVAFGHRESVTGHSFDDYPPGTPLPDLASLDLSTLPPLFRFWGRWRLRNYRAQRMVLIERARDEHWRQKKSGRTVIDE